MTRVSPQGSSSELFSSKGENTHSVRIIKSQEFLSTVVVVKDATLCVRSSVFIRSAAPIVAVSEKLNVRPQSSRRCAAMVVITEADLCGDPEDAAGEKRAKAWAAMCKWIKVRCARKRGVNLPNVFQLFFEVTVADAGSKLRRPVFVLSERFCDNYAVQQLYPPEATVPAVVNGDDLNFYELAIQHSQNLSKDECFVALREMLFKLGEAAGQGHEMRVDFGAGHLVSHGPKVLSFDFAPMFGGAPPRPPRQKVACNDPMLNPKGAVAPSLLLSGMGAASAGGRGATSPGAASPVPVGGEAGSPRVRVRSPVGSGCLDGGGAAASHMGGGANLSEDEQARLFAEVDRLDPEERAAAAEAAFAGWRGDDLAPATKRQIGRVLALPEAQLAATNLNPSPPTPNPTLTSTPTPTPTLTPPLSIALRWPSTPLMWLFTPRAGLKWLFTSKPSDPNPILTPTLSRPQP